MIDGSANAFGMTRSVGSHTVDSPEGQDHWSVNGKRCMIICWHLPLLTVLFFFSLLRCLRRLGSSWTDSDWRPSRRYAARRARVPVLQLDALQHMNGVCANPPRPKQGPIELTDCIRMRRIVCPPTPMPANMNMYSAGLHRHDWHRKLYHETNRLSHLSHKRLVLEEQGTRQATSTVCMWKLWMTASHRSQARYSVIWAY
jgi:hypothetical protein